MADKNSPLGISIPDDKMIAVYNWIDSFTYSRPRKDITRDFSDAVLCAELVSKYLPKLVELHNYTPAHSTKQKIANWDTLNRKVLSKIKFQVSRQRVTDVIDSKPGAIECLLWDLKKAVEKQASEEPTIGGFPVPKTRSKPSVESVSRMSAMKISSSVSSKKEPLQENLEQSSEKSDATGDQCKVKAKLIEAQDKSNEAATCGSNEVQSNGGVKYETELGISKVGLKQGAVETSKKTPQVKFDPAAITKDTVLNDAFSPNTLTTIPEVNPRVYAAEDAQVKLKSTTKPAGVPEKKMPTFGPTAQTGIQDNLALSSMLKTRYQVRVPSNHSRASPSASVCGSDGILEVQPPSSVSSLGNILDSNSVNMESGGAETNNDELVRQYEEKAELAKFLEGEVETLHYVTSGYKILLAGKDRRIMELSAQLKNTKS